MGLLFVGLLGFGAGGLTGTVRSVGTVGEKPLSTQAYFEELQTLIRIRSAQEGRQLSFPEADALGIPIRALQSAVGQRALDNEAAVLGLSVGDGVVSEQVLATPAFRGLDGSFDRETYRQALSSSGLSVRDYETSLREGAARALVQGAVFTGIPDPATYGETVAKFTREGRTFTWAPLTAADVEIILPEPSEEDLQTHYDANPAIYTSLETRALQYVWLTPDMIQDDMPVDEVALREEYEARIEEYVQAERRLIERLVFSDEAAAQAAIEAIETGETSFPELVEDRGLTLEDVDGGDVTEAQMGDAGPAIFALETGGVTGPFQSDLGPALYRVNAVLAARNTTFEQAAPELREDQAAQRAIRLIEDQIDPITNLLAGGALLENVAEQTDMVLGEMDWTADITDGIAAYAAFRDVVANQDVADFPELQSLDDGGLFAVQILEVRAPALIPMDDVRDDVIAGWEAQETAAAVMAEAEAKQARLNEGVQDFGFIGLDAVQENGLTRRGFVNGAPTNFLTEVFDMDIGDVRVLPNDGDAIIVRLDDITGADPEDDVFATEMDAIAQSAAEGIAQDIYELYTRTVQLRTEVNINDAAINAVHANFR
ncbi:peptidylprolyl isomerase [Octadecabacter sp. G9-8]|uniref:Parvulin-like PPIase n=2 Tax=Octadecabacter dasysiphoniae TaxID=2909341 RepID=A0ABS9D2H4_9RHOB|nr:peptidylprolyl isomerase [Octadecabacter dasysiphoniae]